MKRLLTMLTVALALPCMAQRLQGTPNAFYREHLTGEQRPTPYPYLRESDIVWSTTIWKKIDLNEAFNQYIYFPLDTNFSDGRINLADLIWNAIVDGTIPIYEDDDLKVPIDNKAYVRAFTQPDTIRLEIGYDENDNEEYETYIKPRYFESYEVTQYAMREVWFIGKADSRLDSRRIALAPVKDMYRKFAGSEVYIGKYPMFWIPMQNMTVRTLLVRSNAYPNKWNSVGQPSWDMVFLSQHYQAFITRESNVYGRRIDEYMTGESATLEAEAIENKVFDIGDDMWEY